MKDNPKTKFFDPARRSLDAPGEFRVLRYFLFAIMVMMTAMNQLTRITLNPQVMGGKPCIRGLRVTVGTVVGLIASGYSFTEILKLYPYLEEADLSEALAYAA